MKIRKVLDKKVQDRSYHKYLITIPKEIVKHSGLFGDDLKIKADRKKIIIYSNSKEH